jgi:hypothetical protein
LLLGEVSVVAFFENAIRLGPMAAQFEGAKMRREARTSSTFHSVVEAAVLAAQFVAVILDTSLALRGKKGVRSKR